VRILLTNDDGIEAEGLLALREALLRHVPDIDLVVVAPDGNRSALARSITTRTGLWVREVTFPDGTVGYATDGTPVDCVRLANLGILKGWGPQMIVSGINHGANVGDDITYSGTVAAALEGIILGLPGVAVSQQSTAMESGAVGQGVFDFTAAADFTARLVADLDNVPLPEATLLNINVPGTPPSDVAVARLGRRVYSDELVLEETGTERGDLYRIYGEAISVEDEGGTDTATLAAGLIAVTPLHFDLTHHASLEALAAHDLNRLLHERAA
jgi:5'-nucleotidase